MERVKAMNQNLQRLPASRTRLGRHGGAILAVLGLLLPGFSAMGAAESMVMVVDPDEIIPNLGDFADIVHIKATYPDKVWVGDTFTINAHARNELPVPVLLGLEIAPQTDVCGVVSYGSSAGGLSVREHEYLLQPNGTSEQLQVLGSQGLLNGDLITASALFRATGVGECRVSILATVQVPDFGSVALHEEPLPPISVVPLPKDADLGAMEIAASGGCGDTGIIAVPPLTDPVVAAGNVEVKATLKWSEDCPDASDYAFITIEHQVNGAWKGVAAGEIGDTGVETVRGSVSLAVGAHLFRVHAYMMNDWLTWKCVLGLLIAGAAIIALILDPEPVSKTILFLELAAAIGGGILAAAGCRNTVLDEESYTVNVQAKQSLVDGLAEIFVQDLPPILDPVEEVMIDAGQDLENAAPV